MIHKTAQYP